VSIDINKQIRMVVKSGKVDIGAKQTLEAARLGRAKLIILASNCPEATRSEIEYSAKLSQVPMFVFSGTSLDLGSVCEKPYLVSAIAVKEAGDSEILKLAAA
jgi:large subunit ribosomal protein L30e